VTVPIDMLDMDLSTTIASRMTQDDLEELHILLGRQELAVPVDDDRQFRLACRVLGRLFEREATPLRRLAHALRGSEAGDWKVFAPPPCGPDDKVFYKAYVLPPRSREWRHLEHDVAPMGRQLPYLWEPDGRPESARRRAACVEGDLTLLARFTCDAHDKRGLWDFMHVAKRHLARSGVGPIEPLRPRRGVMP
jgi:hypothetical protein